MSKSALLSRAFPAARSLLPGSRNGLGTSEHAETQKIAISRPRQEDPLTMTTRGEASFRRGAWPKEAVFAQNASARV